MIPVVFQCRFFWVLFSWIVEKLSFKNNGNYSDRQAEGVKAK